MFESPTVLQYASFCSCQRTLCRTYKFCISNREFVLLPLAEWIKLRNTLHYLRSSIIYPVLCDRSSKGPFNRAVTPALNTPLPISKPGQRESLFDLSISPKNTLISARDWASGSYSLHIGIALLSRRVGVEICSPASIIRYKCYCNYSNQRYWE